MGSGDAELEKPFDDGTCMGAIVRCLRPVEERRSDHGRLAQDGEPSMAAEEERRRTGPLVADFPLPKEAERMPFVLQPRIVPSVARDLDDGLRLGVLALEEEEERLLGAVRSGRCNRWA